MGKVKSAIGTFLFFALLAVNTALHPFESWRIQSGPLRVMDSLVNAVLVSWAGQTGAVVILCLLAIVFPVQFLSGRFKTMEDLAANRNATRNIGPRDNLAPRRGFGKRAQR